MPRMDVDLQKTRTVVLRTSRHPSRAAWMERADLVILCGGIAAMLLNHSVHVRFGVQRPWEFPVIVFAAMIWLTGSLIVRYCWSLARRTFLASERITASISLAWIVGLVLVVILGPALLEWTSRSTGRWGGFVFLSEIALLLRGISLFLVSLRGAAAGTLNPAFLLVASFFGLVMLGTILLMLPRARASLADETLTGAPFVTALFTATSAACVTGLVVEETRTYWSREGQFVILGLIQVGGLGIMTFGAFFGLIAGRRLGFREHATLGELLESEGLGNVRRLVTAILGFTFLIELLGACALSGLFRELPLGERAFQSVFHAVSAFCNAGFALTENSLVGKGGQWQVWGGITTLIIAGGLGFAVLNDVARFAVYHISNWLKLTLPRHGYPTHRLTLTTRLVLIVTAGLLVSGMLGLFLLERAAAATDNLSPMPVADAWFQSVSFRTAGFNTVDLGDLHPATKLLGILLMFIGASPGSTGGGVKTVVFAVTVLGLISVVRGRQHVECFGRTLPDVLVFRALAVVFLYLLLIMTTTILLVLYEDHPQAFLDYLFEAVSAVGTVGVSSTIVPEQGQAISITQSLSTPSRFVIVIAMFLGRVGPLTLLIAIGGKVTQARYQYPEERVALG
ncbi:MAG: hypothetical protein KF861_14930 [Planctomycetaceae bacterium]|nr:hypothetical protein [Planctomycetaceae bacterium]